MKQPTTVRVTLNKTGKSTIYQQAAGLSATVSINCSNFGMKGLLPGLGKTVKLYIEAEANK